MITKKKIKGLTYKDVVILMFIKEYPLKTLRELSIIIGCDYSSLTQSVKKLLDKNHIIKTNSNPNRYEIN